MMRLLVLGTIWTFCGYATTPCDINQHGATDVSDVQAAIAQALGQKQATADLNSDGVVNVVDVQIVIQAALTGVCGAASPSITSFTPVSGPAGTLVTVTGNNFVPGAGAVPQVAVVKQGGGTVSPPISAVSNTSLSFVIPAGAATGQLTITAGGQTAVSAMPLTITPASDFSISAVPPSANLIQGQNVSYAVQIASQNGFTQMAQLSVSGLPAGVTATFKPASITPGQNSVLTLNAPSGQPIATANLSISASATVGGLAVLQTTPLALAVVAPTTTLLGRTVVSDAYETPLAGVTISTLGKDGNGNTTGCTGLSVTSDSAGNFALTNVPLSCTGPQLVSFDGTTATAPAGKYAGVNLVFTLNSGQVTTSAVLVHLPRIDNVETFQVTQNSTNTQSYSFSSIPGLSVIVYPGTTFTMPDGTKPNPFPLAAVQVPTDRLPDLKPSVPTMMMVFIVAFQPANVTTNQPVAVYFPNVINTPPGTDMALMTLDPTHGTMVPYGTGVVSADGTSIVPDADPAHVGQLYGLVHFDWHGPMPPPPPQVNPGPPGGDTGDGNTASNSGNGEPYPGISSGNSGSCQAVLDLPGGAGWPSRQDNLVPKSLRTDIAAGDLSPTAATGPPVEAGDPVDLFSGIMVLTNVDIAIRGGRSGLGVVRTYRSLTTQTGPFGVGTSHNYQYGIDTAFPQLTPVINLIQPDGNRFPFATQSCSTGPCPTYKTNTTIPAFRGVTMTVSSDNSVDLRWKNGTVYHFVPISFQLGSLLAAIIDPNGNTISITRDSNGNIASVTDPVGRSLVFTNDQYGRVVSIADPIGRSVQYAYNSQGSLATVTDPAGGVTRYAYDVNNNLLQITDPRGIIQVQNTLDSMGHVNKQTRPDGGTTTFAYQFFNPTANTSQAMQTQVTDSFGAQTTYRFNQSGFLTDRTNTQGFTTHMEHDSGTNLLSSVSTPLAGVPSATYVYDTYGNLLSRADLISPVTPVPLGPPRNIPIYATTAYTYDAANNVTSITDPEGHVTHFSYDAHNNMLIAMDANNNVTSFQYDSHGLLLQTTDPLGQKITNTYDSWGNRVSSSDALSKTTTYAYDGISRPTAVTDALGHESTMSYDALGRLLTVTDPTGGTTTSTYDLNGNVLSVKDAKGNTTTFTYDTINRLATRTDPLGNAETRSYDTGDNLTKVVDRRGMVSTYAYDKLNRLVTETYSDATVSRSYDGLNRLVQASDSASGVFTFTYDFQNRLTTTTTPIGQVLYNRGLRGEITGLTQQVQPNSVAYSYDAAGNLTTVNSASLFEGNANSFYSPTVNFTFNGRNQISNVARSMRTGTVSSTFAYDADGRLTGINHVGQAALDIETYSYDTVGNIVNHASSIGHTLVAAAATSLFNSDNQLAKFGTTPYTYDANGNLTNDGTVTYRWDGRNRLQSVASNSQTTTFTYDFVGSLIGQTTSGPSGNLSKQFLLDDLTNVAAETSSDGTGYSVLLGRSLDSYFATIPSNGQSGGLVQFALTDAINSTVMTVDQNGSVSSQLAYDPFGQVSGNSTYPFQFTGRLPVSSSLLNFRSRYYSPVLGRFISEDPLQTANLYAYANNSPLQNRDPLGQFVSILPPVEPYGPPAPEPYGPPPPPGYPPVIVVNPGGIVTLPGVVEAACELNPSVCIAAANMATTAASKAGQQPSLGDILQQIEDALNSLKNTNSPSNPDGSCRGCGCKRQ